MTLVVRTGDVGGSGGAADAAALEASRRYCRELTRAAAKNFYYGLRLLPEPKRSDMFALYAYMRVVDDFADGEDGKSLADRGAALEAWRGETRAVLRGEEGGNGHPLWPAFGEMNRRCGVPGHVFDAAVDGQLQDLRPVAFDTFAQLEEYCYRVAGVVGLASINIWGYHGGEETERKAVALGLAFQLTNILRDLKEDIGRGRMYLPREDWEAAGLTEDELWSGRGGRGFDKLIRFEIDRAEAFYREARGLERSVSADSRATLVAMTEIYHGLLRKVSATPAAVLQKRVSLSTWSKLRIGWRATRACRAAGEAAL